MQPEPPFLLAGRYEVEEEVGRGGFARVFRATDRRAEHTVAVKLLHGELTGGRPEDRFLREIQILSELQHPNILPLLDWGQTDEGTFFVTRLVSGQTLETRLAREGKLPIGEVLRITAELTEALSHAHARGIVHRDVKPSNILFEDGRAYLNDFGIALLLERNDGDRITTSGVGIGSERYMSPEQLVGERAIDARSDIFSLACVVFEMFAGMRPFAASDVQTERLMRMQHPAPSVRRYRGAVPEHIDQALAIALAKDPADRFQTVQDFAQALGVLASPGSDDLAQSGSRIATPAGVAPARARPPLRLAVSGALRRRPAAVGAAVALVALVALVAVMSLRPVLSDRARRDAAVALDTTRYVVFPFEGQEGGGAAPWDQLVKDALARWDGISTVDLFQVRDALARGDEPPRSQEDFRRIARALGAGRFVRGALSPSGGSGGGVRAVLYATDSLVAIAEATGTVQASAEAPDSTAERLAESLLFRDATPPVLLHGVRETSSHAARVAFLAGMRALQSWDLQEADTAFSAAAIADGSYARAAFWRAQVRSWRSEDHAEWPALAERAAQGGERLPARERDLAVALAKLAQFDFAGACADYRRIVQQDSLDFTGWFGLGECRRRDNVVLRDAASPSGWRFRSSYHGALRAYRRAFDLVPSSGRAFHSNTFGRLNSLLMLTATSVRSGHALGERSRPFFAQPSWDARGDTLTLIPYDPESFPRASTATLGVALQKSREALREIVAAWAAAFPEDPNALEARATAEELVGDRAALASVRRALAVATSPEQRLRLQVSEVLLLVRHGAPDSLSRLGEAIARADSLLSTAAAASDVSASYVAALGSLRGAPSVAARFVQQAARALPLDDRRSGGVVPRSVVAARDAFEVHAAALLFPDSARWWADRTQSLLDGIFPGEEAREVGRRIMHQGITLAIPSRQFDAALAQPLDGDEFWLAAAAAIRGDTARARRYVRALGEARRTLPPSERTLDVVAVEAWLLTELRDDRAAAAWLDGSLGALPNIAPEQFRSPVLVAALLRCARLRGEIALRLGDQATARRWTGFVTAMTSVAVQGHTAASAPTD